MKAYQLIASAAATVLTFASISVISHAGAAQHQASSTPHYLPVTNLAAVHVHPRADELRAAALMNQNNNPGIRVNRESRSMQTDSSASFKLLESQVAMPYYSFGNKFGRVSKE